MAGHGQLWQGAGACGALGQGWSLPKAGGGCVGTACPSPGLQSGEGVITGTERGARERSTGRAVLLPLAAWSWSSSARLPGFEAFLVFSSHVFKCFPAPTATTSSLLRFTDKTHRISQQVLACKPGLAMAVRRQTHTDPLWGASSPPAGTVLVWIRGGCFLGEAEPGSRVSGPPRR